MKVAVITGAGRGIGKAIAHRLSTDGFAIAVVDLDSGNAQAVAAEINTAGGKAIALQADIADKAAVEAMIADVAARLGSVDVMVNNAGLVQVKPILDLEPHDIESLFRVNLFGMFYCVQAAARQMIAQGRGGKIINAASVAGHDSFQFSSVYGAAKFGVRGLTQSAAREFAQHGITVNAYCPGVVDTNMWDIIDRDMGALSGAAEGETRKQFVGSIPLGRIQKPEDVAGFVSFLASSDADYMTGQSPIIDGGLVMR